MGMFAQLLFRRRQFLTQLHRATQDAFEKFLKLGTPTVFQHLHDLQRLVSALALSTTIPPRVVMDMKQYKYFIVGEGIAYIEAHRRGLQALFQRFWDQYSDLTQGLLPLYQGPDDGVLLDDLSSESRGYAFFVDKHYVRHGDINAFLYHMIDIRGLAHVSIGGEVSLDRAGCRQLMLDIESLEEIWHFLFQHTTAVHFRIEQLMLHRLVNGDRPRNLLMLGQEMLGATRANKDTNIVEHDSFIAHFLCKDTQKISLEVLCGGIRHALVVLAGVSHSDATAQIYRE